MREADCVRVCVFVFACVCVSPRCPEENSGAAAVKTAQAATRARIQARTQTQQKRRILFFRYNLQSLHPSLLSSFALSFTLICSELNYSRVHPPTDPHPHTHACARTNPVEFSHRAPITMIIATINGEEREQKWHFSLWVWECSTVLNKARKPSQHCHSAKALDCFS